jgi:hypothetical protein
MVAVFTNSHVVNFDHRGHRPEYSSVHHRTVSAVTVTESTALRPSQGIEHRYAEATATTLMGSFGTGAAAETLHNIVLERFGDSNQASITMPIPSGARPHALGC